MRYLFVFPLSFSKLLESYHIFFFTVKLVANLNGFSFQQVTFWLVLNVSHEVCFSSRVYSFPCLSAFADVSQVRDSSAGLHYLQCYCGFLCRICFFIWYFFFFSLKNSIFQSTACNSPFYFKSLLVRQPTPDLLLLTLLLCQPNDRGSTSFHGDDWKEI